jgi:hypothetical protein
MLGAIECEIKVIGKNNVVMKLPYQEKSAQFNFRKIKNKWIFRVKKDTIDWDSFFKNHYTDQYSKYRYNQKFAREQSVELVFAPLLDKYIQEKQIEKILLH